MECAKTVWKAVFGVIAKLLVTGVIKDTLWTKLEVVYLAWHFVKAVILMVATIARMGFI
jgi:hypothetical protein